MVEQGLLGAGVDAFTAFCAGDIGSPLGNTFKGNGEGWTSPHAFHALHAFFRVHAHLKRVRFVGKGLKCTQGAEEAALGSPLGQNGQYDDEADEQGEKDDRLNQDFNGSNLNELSNRLERAQPFTVGGCKGQGGHQDHPEKNRITEIGPLDVDVFQYGSFENP